jgi:hypothetical protein
MKTARHPSRRPITLTDPQLKIVMTTAGLLPQAKRDIFLRRIAAMLKLRGRFNDDDISEVSRLALAGLVHRADSAA